MLQDRTWLLIGRKMANEATPGELQELEDLLRTNPELHFTIQTISGLSQQSPSENYLQIDRAYTAHLRRMQEMGIETPGVEEDQQLPDVSPLLPIPQRRSFKKAFITGLSLAAIIAVIIILVNPSTPSIEQATKLQSEISTRNGSKTYIILPDGTKVWLNSGSKVTYDKKFGETKREVLLTGEAYFDVTHNPDKPFVIHTRAMDIRVLGTEFNVRSYPDENTTETSLIRGSIEVTLKDRRAEKIILKPNEKLVVSNEQDSVADAAVKKQKPELPIISLSHLSYFSLDSTVLETSWVQNRLVFEDESFADLAKRMERWYGVKFVFESDRAQQLRFTGNFKEESVQEALEAMKITADFNYVIDNNIITITNN